jgi:hypothetical protein
MIRLPRACRRSQTLFLVCFSGDAGKTHQKQPKKARVAGQDSEEKRYFTSPQGCCKVGKSGVKGRSAPLAQREVSSQNLFFHVSFAAAGGKKDFATALVCNA